MLCIRLEDERGKWRIPCGTVCSMHHCCLQPSGQNSVTWLQPAAVEDKGSRLAVPRKKREMVWWTTSECLPHWHIGKWLVCMFVKWKNLFILAMGISRIILYQCPCLSDSLLASNCNTIKGDIISFAPTIWPIGQLVRKLMLLLTHILSLILFIIYNPYWHYKFQK